RAHSLQTKRREAANEEVNEPTTPPHRLKIKLGAGVGAGAAMWGAQRAARVSQEAQAVQIRKEDERWKRDQRHTAYQAMIRADMMQTSAAEAVLGEIHTPSDSLTREQEARCAKAHEEAFAALSLIELCGPQSALTTARELDAAGYEMMQVYAFPRSQDNFMDAGAAAYGRHRDALRAFRDAARAALGYGDADDWTPSRQGAA
ncbi:hypothetical protein, partial [Streptomyces sp. NPDC093984]|uniref:hypothetical protein n=1 Tax=Streptomyces sp. NPDC093984 TaxID=3366052 RepID=UPI0038287E7D